MSGDGGIPEFDASGLLPAGTYRVSLDELVERFGKFQHSDRRIRLCEKLADYLELARRCGAVTAVFINGSFVTSKEEPGDIDLIVVLRRGHDFGRELGPDEYNALSKRRVRRLYGFDILVAPETGATLEEWKTFFAQVRDYPERTKGFLRIEL